MTTQYPKEVILDFAKIEIFEDYLISTVKEGILFDLKNLKKLHFIFDTYFPNKLFGFISNREHDYTVDPTCYLQHSKHPRLIGEAVFCHSQSAFKTTQFEKTFYKRPFEAFFSIEQCKNWIRSLKQNSNVNN